MPGAEARDPGGEGAVHVSVAGAALAVQGGEGGRQGTGNKVG